MNCQASHSIRADGPPQQFTLAISNNDRNAGHQYGTMYFQRQRNGRNERLFWGLRELIGASMNLMSKRCSMCGVAELQSCRQRGLPCHMFRSEADHTSAKPPSAWSSSNKPSPQCTRLQHPSHKGRSDLFHSSAQKLKVETLSRQATGLALRRHPE
jgi:hypothetical protein